MRTILTISGEPAKGRRSPVWTTFSSVLSREPKLNVAGGEAYEIFSKSQKKLAFPARRRRKVRSAEGPILVGGTRTYGCLRRCSQSL